VRGLSRWRTSPIARHDSAVPLLADLTSDDPLEGAPRVERFIQTNGIDLLVNNAGATAFGRFDQVALSE
jgi:short-subunit dehydrogenase